jgi:hypothetical protein
MKAISIDLVQPRHNYAPPREEEPFGHVYMPTSLLTAAARLLEAGLEVRVHDENLALAALSSDYVGFNLLGAPYIPEVIELEKRITKESGARQFIVGGRVISGLSRKQLERLFGNSICNGNKDAELARLLGISPESLISSEQTSLIPAYQILDESVMREYLSRPFSFYVSQGCSHTCRFCPADNNQAERYRSAEIISADLDYLTKKAESFGIAELNIYLSNLDVFQNPDKLKTFSEVVKQTRQRTPKVNMRFSDLSRVDSFNSARERYSDSISELVEAGFDAVGFGVDGWTVNTWTKTRKGYRSEVECVDAVRYAKEFGITPEIILVFGHVGIDDERSIKGAFEFTERMAADFGAVPRPHVCKQFIPGNSGWISKKYEPKVENLLQNPELFQGLDFTALPSELTHPDAVLRKLTEEYFLKMCGLPGATTLPTKPITQGITSERLEEVRHFNLKKYDH